MPRERSTVLLVDDHELIRDGLARAFERSRDFEIIGMAESLNSGLRLAREHDPDVIVTDVRLPDGSGLELVTTIRREYPDAALIVLTMYSGDDQVLAAMQAGASAFVAKDAPSSDVVAAARHARGAPRSFAAADLMQTMRRQLSPTRPRLTENEIELLHLLAQGRSVADISNTLFVSESTAKARVSRIYNKLGVSTRAEAIWRAAQSGLLPD